jgi:hypothetical protein
VGSQSAIIGGFAFAALTQIDIPIIFVPTYSAYNPQGYAFTCYAFWVGSAVCMSAGQILVFTVKYQRCHFDVFPSGMHCVMTTIFVQVLGPGLALHGPQGQRTLSLYFCC